MIEKQPESLIRADELEAIGAESSLVRAMAAHTIRLLYKENEALRARLAQPEQEPVVWMYQDKSTNEVKFQKEMRAFVDHGATYEVPLYTAPPQPKTEPVGRFAKFADGVWKEVTNGSAGQPLYTAPPQRERIVFPTMLRKMWSGGEVQAWLDENVNKEKNSD